MNKYIKEIINESRQEQIDEGKYFNALDKMQVKVDRITDVLKKGSMTYKNLTKMDKGWSSDLKSIVEHLEMASEEIENLAIEVATTENHG